MHELSIVEALIEQVEKEVEHSGQSGRVVHVELVIGRLSGVSCDSIRFVLQLLAPNTILDGAEVRITEPRASCRCRDCDSTTEIEELLIECPNCRSRNIVIEGGREMLLQSIELED